MWRMESQVSTGLHSRATSFLVEFDGLNLPEKDLLKLGGEGKAVFYETFSPDKEKLFYFTAPVLMGSGLSCTPGYPGAVYWSFNSFYSIYWRVLKWGTRK